jgi:hypothetical protein
MIVPSPLPDRGAARSTTVIRDAGRGRRSSRAAMPIPGRVLPLALLVSAASVPGARQVASADPKRAGLRARPELSGEHSRAGRAGWRRVRDEGPVHADTVVGWMVS